MIQWFKQIIQKIGRWILFGKDKDNDMAIGRSGMGQQITRPPGKVVPNALRQANPKKVEKVMKEFKKGDLHSGKKGPVVKNPKQAVAIALSEARRTKTKKKK
tara:strand:+ start:1616 stop:1921 length:306 start_codon:yes stop_codon:yes gene_type:complete